MKNTKIQKPQKKRGPVETTIIALRLPFHFFIYHKDQMSALRLWVIGRKLIDIKGVGYFNLKELEKIAKIKREYLLRIINNSKLFKSINKNRCYYVAHHRLLKKHHLRDDFIRGEKKYKTFIKLFSSLKLFKAYLFKCYLEQDFRKDKAKQYTRGRISYEAVACYFQVTRRSVISLIKLSGAIALKNEDPVTPRIRVDADIKNPKVFNDWLLNNLNLKVNGYKLGENVRSYWYKKLGNNYYLRKTLPNIYKFTGIFLVKKKKGATRKRPLIMHNLFC